MSVEVEIWKDVPGYEGEYMVSNSGLVKSLERTRMVGGRLGIRRTYPSKILAAHIVERYFQVVLCKDGRMKNWKVHRLVAMCFVQGHFPGAIINHKDGNRLNNHADNLEWCDQRHNTIHAFRMGLRKGMKDGAHPMARKILDTSTGKIYDTIRIASKYTGESVTYLSNYLNNSPSKMAESARRRLSKFVFC